MTAGRGAVRQHTSLFVVSDLDTRVQPLAEYDRVVVHLGWGSDTALHLDRAAIAALTDTLDQARAALDAAQDEMAAAIEAQQTATRTEHLSA